MATSFHLAIFFFFSFQMYSSKEILNRYKKVPHKIHCLHIQPHTHTYFPWFPLPIFSFSIFSEIILNSILLFTIHVPITSLGLQLLWFFPLEFTIKVHRVPALAAKGATVFLKSCGSCGCCSPGIPQLHSVWHQLSSHSSSHPPIKTGDSSTAVARIISKLMLGRVPSVQAGVNILPMAEVNQNLLHPICHSRVANRSHWYQLLIFQGYRKYSKIPLKRFLKAVRKAPMFAQAQQNSVKCTPFA